jgi:hypothetical protein
MANDFIPFAAGVGANVESQSAYAADATRLLGNQPGIALSILNNKALRQGTVMASQIGQLIANITGAAVQDNADLTQLLSQMFSAFGRKAPVITTHLSGSGTHNLTYKIQVASANATIGAVYTDGTTNFTVTQTISAGPELVATGATTPSTPTGPGTLTKSSGTGDATITYYSFRAPLWLELEMVGGGGGGGGGGASGQGSGSAGNSTTWGGITCGGGQGGTISSTPSMGGAVSGTTTGYQILASLTGSGTGSPIGSNGSTGITLGGGTGGSTPLGGGGSGTYGTNGTIGVNNTGAGAGGGTSGTTTASYPGGGGAAGAYFRAILSNPTGTFAWAVGAGGALGSAGTGTGAGNGAKGGDGAILVREHYQ